MTRHRLDTDKLLRAVDRARRAGRGPEMSYRQVAHLVGVSPDVFTRLKGGRRPGADALCSLLMWIDPEARLVDYTLRDEPEPPRRPREYATATP
jgi:hypothetical protein